MLGYQFKASYSFGLASPIAIPLLLMQTIHVHAFAIISNNFFLIQCYNNTACIVAEMQVVSHAHFSHSSHTSCSLVTS